MTIFPSQLGSLRGIDYKNERCVRTFYNPRLTLAVAIKQKKKEILSPVHRHIAGNCFLSSLYFY